MMPASEAQRVSPRFLRDILAFSGWVLTAVAVWIYAVYFYGHPATEFDDAYMFLRYARHLVEGGGLRWNLEGPPTLGISSLPHLFQLVVFLKTIPLPQETLLVLSSAADGATAVLVMAFCVYFFSASRWLKNFPLILGAVSILLVSSESFLFLCGTGMDTLLAATANALLIAAVLDLERRPSLGKAVAAGLASSFSILCRIDSVLYAGIFPALVILFFVPKPGRVLGCWAGTLLLLLALDTAVKWHVFGEILPLPFYVKQSGYYKESFAPYISNSPRNFGYFFRGCLPFLCGVFLFYRNKDWRWALCFFAPVIVTAAVLFQGIQIMGTAGRFFFPGLPFVVVGSLMLLDKSLNQKDGSPRLSSARLLMRFLMVAVVLRMSPVFFYQWNQGTTRWLLEQSRGKYDERWVGLVKKKGIRDVEWWAGILHMDRILQKLPESLVFAVSEDGYLSSRYPRMKMIDLNGLHDRYLARHGFDAAYVLSQKPDMIWLPHWAYPASTKAFWRESGFWQDYDYYPRAFIYGLAIRRDSPLHDTIHEAVAAEWGRVYPGVAMDREMVSGPLKKNPDGFPDGFGTVQDYFLKESGTKTV